MLKVMIESLYSLHYIALLLFLIRPIGLKVILVIAVTHATCGSKINIIREIIGNIGMPATDRVIGNMLFVVHYLEYLVHL